MGDILKLKNTLLLIVAAFTSVIVGETPPSQSVSAALNMINQALESLRQVLVHYGQHDEAQPAQEEEQEKLTLEEATDELKKLIKTAEKDILSNAYLYNKTAFDSAYASLLAADQILKDGDEVKQVKKLSAPTKSDNTEGSNKPKGKKTSVDTTPPDPHKVHNEQNLEINSDSQQIPSNSQERRADSRDRTEATPKGKLLDKADKLNPSPTDVVSADAPKPEPYADDQNTHGHDSPLGPVSTEE